ncbi:AraC family transcriptional regulator [Aerococcus viridans]|uniref:AraC family transcriptional regulator n=1 Tax=Aerococcus TaxID=1375 RepID=UPI00288CDBBA|nr:AraC family transcriptional regulator [Aerococcus urinaeequi]MDT2762258.1 AraC family transcriptional regulator [Aerococcus urinaeequi]
MLKELNQVMNFIDDHLSEDISLTEVADYAGVSDYHFRQVFFYLSGMTLHEYIKGRKLSEANKELLNQEKVTDIAFKYGYESVEGFSRAFKKWSGYLPSEVSKLGVSKLFPKLNFYIDVKGGESMEYKFIEKPSFKFAGVSKRVPMQFEGVNNAIVELANSITPEQRETMQSIKNLEPEEIVNVSYDHINDFMEDNGDLTHMIGVLTTEEVPSNLNSIEVPATTWAVFPNEGPFPKTLQDTYARIYSEWLPVADVQLVDVAKFSFTKMDEEKADYAYSEVWLPVERNTH